MERFPYMSSIRGMKWIYKPADGNKASGIRIFEDVRALEQFLVELGDDPQVGVIQCYLEDPWLVEYADPPNDPEYFAEKFPYLESKKFDMRMFLLVTYEPREVRNEYGEVRRVKEDGTAAPWMKAYLHRDGVCRFSTADYDINDLSEENRRAHLTNNALNKNAVGYKASNNLISLQDLERLMPAGWSLDQDFYPFVRNKICAALVGHLAGGLLPRRGFQLFGIDLMLVRPENPWAPPEIYLLEVNLRPKLEIPDDVSVKFQQAVKSIIDDVIVCIEKHHGYNRGKGRAECEERENRFDEVYFELGGNHTAAASEEQWQDHLSDDSVEF